MRDERHQCLARQVVLRQQRAYDGRRGHSPDRKAQEHGFIGALIRHPRLQRRFVTPASGRTGDRHDPGLLRQQPGQRDLRGVARFRSAQAFTRSTNARLCGRLSGENRDSIPRMPPSANRVLASIAPARKPPRAGSTARSRCQVPRRARSRLLPAHAIASSIRSGRRRQAVRHARGEAFPAPSPTGPSAGPAFRHQVLDRACHVFDRHCRVDAVLVEEIDAVGAQALQHALDHNLDVVRTAVQAGRRSPVS